MTRLDERELGMMDSRLRRLSQRAIELRAFRRMLERAKIDLRGKHLLDAGCGNGFGLELLAKAFRPARLVGFDLMPEQIERARRRNVAAELSVGDITAIAQPDASFDGVFVFGILHHVPAWRDALRELGRVLRPGGVLLVEEAAFDWPQFLTSLNAAGLSIIGEQALLGNAIRSFAAIKR